MGFVTLEAGVGRDLSSDFELCILFSVVDADLPLCTGSVLVSGRPVPPTGVGIRDDGVLERCEGPTLDEVVASSVPAFVIAFDDVWVAVDEEERASVDA